MSCTLLRNEEPFSLRSELVVNTASDRYDNDSYVKNVNTINKTVNYVRSSNPNPRMNVKECLNGKQSPNRIFQPSSVGNNILYYSYQKNRHGGKEYGKRSVERERRNEKFNTKSDHREITPCTVDLTARNTVLGTLKTVDR